MSPRLEAPRFELTPNSASEAKFVDKPMSLQGLSPFYPNVMAPGCRAIWLRPEPAASVVANAPFLGSRARREALWSDVSRSAIERGDELAASFNEQVRLRSAAILSDVDRQTAEEREVERQLAELDEEETSPRRVADHLPEALAAFLRAMPPARRREREQAIIDKVGWEGVNLLDLDPRALAIAAETRARQYAELHPRDDERFQTPEHRRLREPKTWRRKLTKQARKARAYVEGAVGAVGGPERPGRPLYVSNYTMQCHRADLRQSREHMERLRIVKLDDPTVQIPLIEAHQRKLVKEAAKRRLMLDVHIVRAEAIGARTVWTTLTLPGAFHPHASNEGKRAEAWNPDLGPDEAMQQMQKLFHQTMCLIRERGARPWGFWDAQAQQDGTPHRHLPAFVHDRGMSLAEAAALADPDTPEEVAARIRADSEARVLQEAREVADGFWERFSSVPAAARQEEARRVDHGCRAYVIGDTDPRYAPPRGRDGNEETCASIVKYTARYATRLATGAADLHEVAGGEGCSSDAVEDRPVSDLERHAAWATSRRARLHNWVGVASSRSPSRLWDAVWKAAERGEMPKNARMELAVIHMIDTQNHLAEVGRVRAELRETKNEPLDDDERDNRIRRLNDEVTAGAGCGAALGMILNLSPIAVQFCSFALALLAVSLSLTAARVLGRGSITVMILSGMVIAALFSALISLMKFLADPLDALPAITYWLMGGLSKASLSDLIFAAGPVGLCLAIIYLLRSQIHILALNDDEAESLGVNVRTVRITLIVASTLMTAMVVSFTGIIGWVGLIVPHISRMMVGANFGRLLPVTFLVGAIFLLVVDNFARTLSSVEVPIGVITALVGTPFFFFLLARLKRVWD